MCGAWFDGAPPCEAPGAVWNARRSAHSPIRGHGAGLRLLRPTELLFVLVSPRRYRFLHGMRKRATMLRNRCRVTSIQVGSNVRSALAARLGSPRPDCIAEPPTFE